MKRILVVEDDELLRGFLVMLYELAGHTVAKATNGAEGLELFKAGDFDMVFTDLTMPAMDGIQLTRAVKTLSPDVRVVIASGNYNGDAQQRALEAGVFMCLTKPMGVEEIQRAAT